MLRCVVVGTTADELCEVGSAALPLLIESDRVKSMEFGRRAGCRGGDTGVLGPSLWEMESLPMSKLLPRSCCCIECLGVEGEACLNVSNV